MLHVHEAEETLGLAEKYMGELGCGIDALSRIRLTDKTIKHLDSLLALTVHNGAFANFNVVNQFVDGTPVQFRQIQVFSDDCHPILNGSCLFFCIRTVKASVLIAPPYLSS